MLFAVTISFPSSAAFHICASDGTGGLTKYSFLCPNGTLFNQQYFVCDWWFNVDCSKVEDLYYLNQEIGSGSEDSGKRQKSDFLILRNICF